MGIASHGSHVPPPLPQAEGQVGWKLLRVKIHYVASKKARKSIGVWFLILYIAEIKHFFKLFLLITF